MNTAADILSYAQTHDINLVAENGLLKIDAPEKELTDEFLESAKQYKQEIIRALSERWNPELANEGYQWCYDCVHWNGQCTSQDNPYAAVEQQPQFPRICKWYLAKGVNNGIS